MAAALSLSLSSPPSPQTPPLAACNLLPFPSSLSPSHSAQIHARALRLNLTPSSPSSRLLHLYNSLIRSFTSLNPHSLSFSLLPSLLSLNLLPNQFTFPFLLKSSTHLNSPHIPPQQLHALLLKSDLISNVFCTTALLDSYAKLGPLAYAIQLFDTMPDRSAATWNTMVSALIRNGFVDEGLEMFAQMEGSSLEVGTSSWNSAIAACAEIGNTDLAMRVLGEMALAPNSATFNTLLPLISEISGLARLKELHGFVIRKMEVSVVDPIDEDRLWSSIAAGYACNGSMSCASMLFQRVKLKNAYLGNSMISGYLSCGRPDDAFCAFREMANECILKAMILSKVSLTLLLPECNLDSKTGLEIHAYAVRTGLESDASVGNALMAMYSKRRDQASVDIVFARILDKDVVSWNTIMSSYAQALEFDHAFGLFRQMLDEGLKPDEFSFSLVLSMCSHSSCLRGAIAVHASVMKTGLFPMCPIVQNALMDAYGKCGSLPDARRLFDEMQHRDTISWNTMISCYGFSASPCEAISLFATMVEHGLRPNRSTFVALLSACSHAGLLNEGLHYFESMERDHGVVPDLDHYVCIVDCMCRIGELERAYQFVEHMPMEPDECVWSALLNGCRIHGNVEIAEVAGEKLMEKESRQSGYWVLMSNVYADALRWGDKARVWSAMKGGGVKKSPGCSWIEVGGNETHRFLSADESHEKCGDIYLAIDGLSEQLKDDCNVITDDT